MAINKIIVDGVTKIDLSQDTVTANKVLEGLTFHDATGSLCTGTMKQSTGSTGSTGSVGVGDITLYTKLAYTYDEYVANSSMAGQATVYFEDGSDSHNAGFFYISVYSDGSIENVTDGYGYSNVTPPSGGKVYVVSTSKITSVDVNFGGGCGS